MSAIEGGSFDDLRERQRVSCTEGMVKKGHCAENVRPI
jgi:cold shock CspA family protein